jgi:hypothetical protein
MRLGSYLASELSIQLGPRANMQRGEGAITQKHVKHHKPNRNSRHATRRHQAKTQHREADEALMPGHPLTASSTAWGDGPLLLVPLPLVRGDWGVGVGGASSVSVMSPDSRSISSRL